MKVERALAWGLAGGLFLLPAARAVSADENPFRSIVQRNPFSLVPPPPPPPPPDNTPPPSNIKLTGITTILGIKNALLLAQDPGPGGKTQSFILTEGQREGAVEVLTIDTVGGIVKIINAGKETTLSFDKDGLKAPAAPATPGTMPMPGGPIPIPTRHGMPMPGGPVPAVPVPTSAAPAAPANTVIPGNGLRQLPSRSLRMPQSSAQLTQPAAAAGSAPEAQVLQQVIMMHVDKENTEKQGVAFPPLPPIPGLTDGNGE